MIGVLVDSNIILDIVEDDPAWADWSESHLEWLADRFPIYINPIIYSEVSIGFKTIEEVENVINGMGIKILQIPKEALFLAGKAFLSYKTKKGTQKSILPDFFIGAHAAIDKLQILTRDISRYRTYFPSVKLVSP